MSCQPILKSAFTDFSFIKPTEKFLDGRTLLYCLPVVRNIMRIATAITSIHQTRKSDAQPITDLEKKRNWMDIAKWGLGSLVADILPLAFFPFACAIAAIATLFALIVTGYEQYNACKDVTPAKAFSILSASA